MLSPYRKGGVGEGLVSPGDDDGQWSGAGLVAPGGDDSWSGAWIVGDIDERGLCVNRPPLGDPVFVELVYRMAVRADCFIAEPGSGDLLFFTDEQEECLRDPQCERALLGDGSYPSAVVRIHSPQELFEYYPAVMGQTEAYRRRMLLAAQQDVPGERAPTA